ncbi:MAG: FAD-dependent oxidoreductase [Thermogemmatispora sp.]|uniref:oxidoreductase n=1 Tax=Thermogemmatispora sp. TaxID=1968838 RepID=UPI00261C082F|nr:FAD-dependent oxidoreductase [Thermogemmatispora sp.]MBX5457696.1 FAD-dependent oxidoreductase [Thermogemmatispora sp.]
METKLFQPISIGPREARNRLIFGSHTTNFARHHLLSEQHGDYYASRAEGGVGSIVLEEHIVHVSDFPYEAALFGYLPETPAALARVSARVHAAGALTIVQLNHNGQQGVSDHHQRELWAPSAVPDVATREVPKAMELEDIRAVIAGFALVAQHAVRGEADGVELQVADRSLLRQFLSPLTNQRSDAYGGSLENRLRFLQETIEAVAAVLQGRYILGVRLCVDELAPWAGLTPEQGVEIARRLAETGRVHYLTVTMGSILSTHLFPFHASMHVAPGYTVALAAAVKQAVSLPVFAAGRIMDAEQAEAIVAAGQADGVEMIRPLIADPALPRLAQVGKAERVRPCLACNQGCQVRGLLNAALSCNVNPDVLHPWPPSISLLTEPAAEGLQSQGSQVSTGKMPSLTAAFVVIGAGPAGLEAARTAALRGRRVVVFERESEPGGAVALAARAPGRASLRRIIDYLVDECQRLGVELQTGIAVSASWLLEQRPGAVLVATGAKAGQGLLPLPGHDLPHVLDVRRILQGERVTGAGQRAVVIDETASHGVLSTVELLANEGWQIEIVTEDWYVGRDLVATHDLPAWLGRVLSRGVVMTPHTSVVRIEPGQVVVRDRFSLAERALPADMVVLGVYEQPDQDLYFALKGHLARLRRAGDCLAPRRIEQAIAEGRQAGLWA